MGTFQAFPGHKALTSIMSAFTTLFGPTLQTKDGMKPTEEVLAGKACVGVYFSAHWCPPMARKVDEVRHGVRHVQLYGERLGERDRMATDAKRRARKRRAHTR